MQLESFNVTVLCFDPNRGPSAGQTYVLPVDSPNAEHAVSAAMSNAVAFTPKLVNGKPLSIAFLCTAVEPR